MIDILIVSAIKANNNTPPTMIMRSMVENASGPAKKSKAGMASQKIVSEMKYDAAILVPFFLYSDRVNSRLFKDIS